MVTMKHNVTKACAKRPKGAPENVRRVGPKAVSRMARRCPDSGGPSGKSNNGGKAPTFERTVFVEGVKRTVKTQPGKGRPSKHYPLEA
jgi:hypothetical protein